MGVPILVVDDFAMQRDVIRIMLSAAGYTVYTAADAPDALAVVDAVHPRLILMDVRLQGMNGLELTRRLKADPATRDIIIVAHTAEATPASKLKALETGCDGYLTKPIDVRTLATTVAGYLACAEADLALRSDTSVARDDAPGT